MPYFISKNTSLYYEQRGQGPVLLFISPPGLGCAAFEQQHPLEDQFRVVTFDPRGNGRSERSEAADGTIRQWTEDIYALVSHLGTDQVILCGYSFGGLPAQEFAYKYPEKTKALVLISSFPKVRTFLLAGKFRLGIWSTYENLLGTLGKGLAFSHTKKQDQQARIEKNIENSDPGIMEQMYLNGRHYDSTSLLPYITCPALTIFGSNDVFVKKHQQDFKSRLPHVQNVHIQGKVHQLPTRAAEEVNAIIRNFVNNNVYAKIQQDVY
ncbi:alpha/beta fold hydrolase [Marinococcus luteus]|uniref:alpha/beta fold hydrolase n=1 Tax=Marinococcus luteus TaxID=1122204 RepID=UPI002ACC83C3|nr:alpha/beta hydrolase [Marinococcus luteus]MDZ5783052.1 alpha/beta hydrolase [Marinococcus luteus]